MFMTGKEIQTHISPWPGDIQGKATMFAPARERETNSELWERKYDESVTNADMGGAEHGEKYSNLAQDIAHEGFKSPRIPVNFETKEVLGGHHRVAVAAEEHPNYLFPVVHHDNIHDARQALKDHY
jgi:hypothetical protein